MNLALEEQCAERKAAHLRRPGVYNNPNRIMRTKLTPRRTRVTTVEEEPALTMSKLFQKLCPTRKRAIRETMAVIWLVSRKGELREMHAHFQLLEQEIIKPKAIVYGRDSQGGFVLPSV